MKYLILSLLFFPSVLIGQHKGKIYLHSGMKVKGELKFNATKDSLTVSTSEMKATYSIGHIVELDYKRFDSLDFKNYREERRFFFGGGVGLFSGSHNAHNQLDTQPSIDFLTEFRYDNLLNVGLGGSLNWYEQNLISPVFLQYMLSPSQAYNAPVFLSRIGHGFILKDRTEHAFRNTSGGIYAAAGIGYQRKVNDNYFIVALIHEIQKLTEERPLYHWGGLPGEYDMITTKRNLRRIAVKVIIMF